MRRHPSLPVACLAVALAAACSSGQPAASGPTAGTPATAAPPAGPPLPSGPGAGPAVPTTTPPFAQVTPGVVTTTGGVQQVLLSGFNDAFNPGVVRVHPGRLRVILRNDDNDVHNLIFQGAAKGRTDDLPPGQAGTVDLTLTKPGLYDFVCSIHELVGMRGQLRVS